ATCLSRLSVVCKHNAGPEETRQDLTPCRPRLHSLIDNSGVASEINGRLMNWLDSDGTEARMVAIKFERQFVIPIKASDLTGLQLDQVRGVSANLRHSYVGVESTRH